MTGDIALIETKYLRKFVDDAIQGRARTSKAWSKRTGNDAIKIIRSLFKYAVEEEYLSKNPASKLEMMRTPAATKADYFTDDQLELIWTKIKSHWVDPLKFIVHTGLRKAELIHLRWKAVNLTKGQEQITVESYDDWETKTGNSRMIPLNSEALEIVKRQKGKNVEYVFTSPTGQKIHPDKIYRALKNVLTDLQIEGDVHKIRHTFSEGPITHSFIEVGDLCALAYRNDGGSFLQSSPEELNPIWNYRRQSSVLALVSIRSESFVNRHVEL